VPVGMMKTELAVLFIICDNFCGSSGVAQTSSVETE
jgi:hypothetical protein